MQISVELTLTPPQDDFEVPVKGFISKLRSCGFTIFENRLSTQIYGEYFKVMSFLTEEIKKAFASSEHVLLDMKILKSNQSKYAADL